MINVYDPLLVSAAPLVDAESFPPIVAPTVTTKVEVTPGTSGVPETTKPVNSMDVVDVLAKNGHVTSEVPPIMPEVEATPGPSGVSLLAAVESMDGVENVPVVENVTVVEDNNDINENITVENSSIENITKINVVKDKDNVGISDFSSQESRGMECSDSPDISSFSSSTKAYDLSSHFGVVCSLGSMRSSGCAILFRPSLFLWGSRYDTEGHYLQYKLSFQDQSFRVCCLYVPNRNPAQDHFLNDLQTKIDLSVPSLLCGDFNTVFNRALDRRGSDPSDSSHASTSALRGLFNKCCVVDIFRYLHPSRPGFMWTKWNGALASRIYLVSIPSLWVSSVSACSMVPCPFSDLCGVQVSVTVPDIILSGPGLWKLNTAILKDVEYAHLVSDFWQAWRGSMNNFSSLAKWWDAGKSCPKGLSITYCKVSMSSPFGASCLLRL